MGHVIINGVYCYGEVRDYSNFYIVCEDEEYDCVWADGNPDSSDYTFSNWTEVVRVLKREYRADIVELMDVELVDVEIGGGVMEYEHRLIYGVREENGDGVS